MKITVIGGGTWGLALSQVLLDNGHEVMVYARNKDTVDSLNNNKTAPSVFDNHVFPNEMTATDDLEFAVKDRDGVVLSVPTSALDGILSDIAPYIGDDTVIINTAKGFDRKELTLPYAAIERAYPERNLSPVSLVGPSHAEEVVERKLTCICSVSGDKLLAEKVQSWFSNNYLRVYTGSDPIGAEVGAAIKNVIALAAGMADGLGIGGDNAKAALVSRGICEILRFGLYKGAKKETFFGLTGVGDLVVTCFSVHSRNYRAGYAMGKANSVGDFFESNKKTVEGVFSCKVIAEEARANGIEMPLVEAVYNVLFMGETPLSAVENVMLRPLKEE